MLHIMMLLPKNVKHSLKNRFPDIEIIGLLIRELRDPNALYLVENDDLKALFVHIPKTAGISISTAIFNREVNHKKAKYFMAVDRARFDRYFKFTFVRNPWDRMLSTYMFLKAGGKWGNCPHAKWLNRKFLHQHNNFRDFIKSLENPKIAKSLTADFMFMPQYKYLCDNDLNIIVNYIGYFENLAEDFSTVCQQIGIKNRQLNHLNKTSQGKLEYRQHYDHETADIVANLYSKDIEILGYSF